MIRRDVRGVSVPGRGAFLTDSKTASKGPGIQVKLEEDGHPHTFRFSLPERKVADTEFTLWGPGATAGSVTYRFRLGEFWNPKQD